MRPERRENQRGGERDLLAAVHRAVHHVAQQIPREIVPLRGEEPLDPREPAAIEEIGDHRGVVEDVAEHFGGLDGANAVPGLLDLHQRVEAVGQSEELLVGGMAAQNAGQRAEGGENHVSVRRHEAVDDFDDPAAGSDGVLRPQSSAFPTLQRASLWQHALMHSRQ